MLYHQLLITLPPIFFFFLVLSVKCYFITSGLVEVHYYSLFIHVILSELTFGFSRFCPLLIWVYIIAISSTGIFVQPQHILKWVCQRFGLIYVSFPWLYYDSMIDRSNSIFCHFLNIFAILHNYKCIFNIFTSYHSYQ